MIKNEWVAPYKTSGCTFDLKTPESESPHRHQPRNVRRALYPTILDVIGNTPLVRINSITADEGIECDVYGKCEFLNPGGSTKDRIAMYMIENGEAKGLYNRGDTLIEPTSGNTGVGLAMVSAVKGYKCVIVMPEKMSKEKCDVLQMLGAKLFRTRTLANADDEDSNFKMAFHIKNELGESGHVPYQYGNADNPLAHYDQTAEEISEAFKGENTSLDMLVAGVGTGGTITGLGRKIKKHFPNCEVVGVDPVGSSLSSENLGTIEPIGHYDVEGIGYDFNPTVLDRNVIDSWERISDKETFEMARRLIRQEGLLVGGSSGSAMVGAIRAIKRKKLGKGSRVVVILPDSIRNYMTKFVSDDWMYANDYLDYPETELSVVYDQTIDLMIKSSGIKLSLSVYAYDSIQSVIGKSSGEHAIVISKGNIVAVFDPKRTLKNLISGRFSLSDVVLKISDKEFKQLKLSDSVKKLSRYLMYHPYVLVKETQQAAYVIHPSDLLRFGTKITP